MGDLVNMSAYRKTPDPWLNKREAANHLGMSGRWLQLRAADSGLPVHKIGGVNLYRASELDAWVAGYTREGA